MLYVCNLCGQNYPYLIFEFNSIVCEKCSLHKSIKGCEDLELDTSGLEANDPVLEEEVEIELRENDVEQLYSVIDKISNPQIREDFMHMAEEYLNDCDKSEE